MAGQVTRSSTRNKKILSVPCIECGRMYASEPAVKLHYKKVHGRSRFKCTFCDIGFSEKKYLQKHNHDVHPPPVEICKHEQCSTGDIKRSFHRTRDYRFHRANHAYNEKTSVRYIDAHRIKVEDDQSEVAHIAKMVQETPDEEVSIISEASNQSTSTPSMRVIPSWLDQPSTSSGISLNRVYTASRVMTSTSTSTRPSTTPIVPSSRLITTNNNAGRKYRHCAHCQAYHNMTDEEFEKHQLVAKELHSVSGGPCPSTLSVPINKDPVEITRRAAYSSGVVVQTPNSTNITNAQSAYHIFQSRPNMKSAKYPLVSPSTANSSSNQQGPLAKLTTSIHKVSEDQPPPSSSGSVSIPIRATIGATSSQIQYMCNFPGCDFVASTDNQGAIDQHTETHRRYANAIVSHFAMTNTLSPVSPSKPILTTNGHITPSKGRPVICKKKIANANKGGNPLVPNGTNSTAPANGTLNGPYTTSSSFNPLRSNVSTPNKWKPIKETLKRPPLSPSTSASVGSNTSKYPKLAPKLDLAASIKVPVFELPKAVASSSGSSKAPKSRSTASPVITLDDDEDAMSENSVNGNLSTATLNTSFPISLPKVDDSKRYKCVYCGYESHCSRKMRQHFESAHKGNLLKVIRLDKAPSTKSSPPPFATTKTNKAALKQVEVIDID